MWGLYGREGEVESRTKSGKISSRKSRAVSDCSSVREGQGRGDVTAYVPAGPACQREGELWLAHGLWWIALLGRAAGPARLHLRCARERKGRRRELGWALGGLAAVSFFLYSFFFFPDLFNVK